MQNFAETKEQIQNQEMSQNDIILRNFINRSFSIIILVSYLSKSQIYQPSLFKKCYYCNWN